MISLKNWNCWSFGSFVLLFFSLTVHSAILEVGPGKSFTTIQSAVDEAFPGDTIIVSPDAYYEQVLISIPNVSLVSAEFQETESTTKDTTLVNAGGSGNRAITISANNVIVRGFTIHNYTNGIYIENCSATIDHCIIYNTGASGTMPRGISVYLTQSSNSSVTITNNEIFDNIHGGSWYSSGGRGINISSDKPGTACEVLIDHNHIYSNDQRGISVAHLPATITNNHIHDSGVYYLNRVYNCGIVLAFNKGNILIQGNTVEGVIPGNSVYAGGIYLFGDIGYGYEPGYYGSITISDNIINTGSQAPGINLNGPDKDTFDIYIIHNTISGSKGQLGGMYIWTMRPFYVAYVDVIEENTLVANKIGIRDWQCDIGFFHNNNIYNNTDYGLHFRKDESQGILDSTSNWWGHSSGPSGGVLDPITGIPANGVGDTITENVHFDPWLANPYGIPIKISIDIKPGSFPNSLNPRSKGVIPVAVLTTDTFDAATVDGSSIRFAPDEAEPVHYALEDVDWDGDLDMIFHFRTQKTGIKCGDTEATLIGEKVDGKQITGTDSIRTVGCKEKK